MNTLEKRSTIGLALIFAVRMLGLFMILPVFTLYAHNLSGSTPLMIGLALGIYGLTQACLQLPFGMLSDKIGRKKVITFGLVLFALGSVVAAMSHSLIGIIAGRALQGAGAIGSTTIALLADLTQEHNRTKAMATIGMAIGTSFFVAMISAPLLKTWINVNGIFWLTSGLAIVAIIVLHAFVPSPQVQTRDGETQTMPGLLKSVLQNSELLRLDSGIFVQHAILTATFVVLPVTLHHLMNLAEHQQWKFYLPVMTLAFFMMVPFIIIAEKKQKMKPIFIGAITLVAITQFAFGFCANSIWPLGIIALLYFTAFNLLEASLPSMISKIAPKGSKGTAMGIYSTSQFLGIFFGGSLGGFLYGHHYVHGVFYASTVLAALWLGFAIRMRKPQIMLKPASTSV